MLGTQNPQPQLFAYTVDLNQRIRADHPLRDFTRVLGDLSWIRDEVAHCYGRKGNVSVDPVVLIKLMLLLFLDDIPSERELMAQLPVRLDYLWFLNFTLDDQTPNHSVLSKARARWGAELFEKLFIRVVSTCVEAGLVEGDRLHLDSTLVRANVAKDAVVKVQPEILAALRKAYQEQERKLEQGPAAAVVDCDDAPNSPEEAQSISTPNGETSAGEVILLAPAPGAGEPADQMDLPSTGVNANHLCLTDPDATLARKGCGIAEPRYKQHRAIDDAHGVITAVQTTTGIVSDASQLANLIDQHQRNTGQAAQTVVGDKHYGTAENYRLCQSRNITTHLGQYESNLEEKGLMDLSYFTFEHALDRYRCPQGHYLYYHNFKIEYGLVEYRIEKAELCAACPLKAKCTKAKAGRSVTRPTFHLLVQEGREQGKSAAGERSRRRRRWAMEGSFAESANNHGMKRSRWRRLWRQKIQDWLIATVQNLKILIRSQRRVVGGEGVAAKVVAQVIKAVGKSMRAALFTFERGLGRRLKLGYNLTSNCLLLDHPPNAIGVG
jgi:transposase